MLILNQIAFLLFANIVGSGFVFASEPHDPKILPPPADYSCHVMQNYLAVVLSSRDGYERAIPMPGDREVFFGKPQFYENAEEGDSSVPYRKLYVRDTKTGKILASRVPSERELDAFHYRRDPFLTGPIAVSKAGDVIISKRDEILVLDGNTLQAKLNFGFPAWGSTVGEDGLILSVASERVIVWDINKQSPNTGVITPITDIKFTPQTESVFKNQEEYERSKRYYGEYNNPVKPIYEKKQISFLSEVYRLSDGRVLLIDTSHRSESGVIVQVYSPKGEALGAINASHRFKAISRMGHSNWGDIKFKTVSLVPPNALRVEIIENVGSFSEPKFNYLATEIWSLD